MDTLKPRDLKIRGSAQSTEKALSSVGSKQAIKGKKSQTVSNMSQFKNSTAMDSLVRYERTL